MRLTTEQAGNPGKSFVAAFVLFWSAPIVLFLLDAFDKSR